MRRGAGDLDPEHEHALGLHADVEVGGLAGDGEVAAVALRAPGRWSRAARPPPPTPRRTRRGSGRARRPGRPRRAGRTSSPRARPSCRRRRARRGGRRPRAASNSSGLAGTTSRWPWKTTVGDAGRADRGRQHGPAVVHLAGHLHVAGLQPALHEAGRALHPLEGGRVVGDQALGESALVHPE